MNDIMIDLESLGQEPGNVILTLSAVQFNLKTGETGRIFNNSININSCIKYGLTIDPSTVLWWMKQNDTARMQLVESQQNSLDLKEVLNMFSVWLTRLPHATDRLLLDSRDINVWGRGPRFDMGLLSYAYKATGWKWTPWDFRKERCVRTYESLHPNIKEETKFEGVLHNGVDDAKHQIKYVSAIHKKLNNL